MPYSSPATVSDGTTAPASWGNSVKAATDYLANPPHCGLQHSVAQSHLTTGGWQAIVFDTENEDTASMHSTVSNTSRITVPDPGLYVVSAAVEFAASATGVRALGIRKNGAPTGPPNIRGRSQNGSPGAANPTWCFLSSAVKLAAADFIEAVAYQNSGGALSIGWNVSEVHPYFTATWVGFG